jgi:hypothetical protein
MRYLKLFLALLVGIVAVMIADKETELKAKTIVVPAPIPDDYRDEAVRKQALKWGLNPELALSISHRENFSGQRDAWSYNHCCVGIMQVHVRIWTGAFDEECGGSDLLAYDTNACYGVLILKTALKECKQDIECALYKYRGAPDTAYVTKILAEVE